MTTKRPTLPEEEIERQALEQPRPSRTRLARALLASIGEARDVPSSAGEDSVESPSPEYGSRSNRKASASAAPTRYKIALRQSEEGFSVSVPGLPGCWSQGETEAEAIENIREAIRDYLHVVDAQLREEGLPEIEVSV